MTSSAATFFFVCLSVLMEIPFNLIHAFPHIQLSVSLTNTFLILISQWPYASRSDAAGTLLTSKSDARRVLIDMRPLHCQVSSNTFTHVRVD